MVWRLVSEGNLPIDAVLDAARIGSTQTADDARLADILGAGLAETSDEEGRSSEVPKSSEPDKEFDFDSDWEEIDE